MAAWGVPEQGLGMYSSPHAGGTNTRVSETGGYLVFILLHKAPRRPSSVGRAVLMLPGREGRYRVIFSRETLEMYLPYKPQPQQTTTDS